MPQLAGLRHQVIHNDLNLHNVLVDPKDGARVAGVIDFGDMVRGRCSSSLQSPRRISGSARMIRWRR